MKLRLVDNEQFYITRGDWDAVFACHSPSLIPKDDEKKLEGYLEKFKTIFNECRSITTHFQFKQNQGGSTLTTIIIVRGNLLEKLHSITDGEFQLRVQGRIRHLSVGLDSRYDSPRKTEWNEFEVTASEELHKDDNENGSSSSTPLVLPKYAEEKEKTTTPEGWTPAVLVKYMEEKTATPEGWDPDGKKFEGSLTIEVVFDSVHLVDFGPFLDGGSILRKMFENCVNPDFHLVAANGTEIPCHKAVLSVQSEVLQVMLESGMEESKTSKLEMKRKGGKEGVKISEKGVRAFLEFLYCQKVQAAVKDSNVALELLELAHQYGIPSLETAMQSVIIERCPEWLEVDVALELFFHSRFRENFDAVKLKVLEVLRLKFEKLKESTLYQEFFPDESGRELFELSLSSNFELKVGCAIS